ncbi:MAG: Fic family protein [Christensenella sp.]|nr:Fic family protein [Christensenella sp.]
MSYWKIKYDAAIDFNDPELAALNAKIETLRGVLSRAPLTAQLHDEINRLQIIHQVRGTTGIEGNTLSENAVEEVLRKQAPKDAEERETLNAYRALQAIFREKIGMGDCCVSEEMIKRLHTLLTDGLNQNDNVPGQYRLQKIKVGHNFEGERFENIPAQMKAFLQYINSEEVRKYGELIRAVLAHFYLVTIHPFSDGNGRTSRMLEDCILYNSNYNSAGFFSLSNFYYKHRDEYFSQLDEARFKHNGNLQEFVKFSLKGFCEELQSHMEKVMQQYNRICYSNYLEERLQQGDVSQRQYSLLCFMMKYDQIIDEAAVLKRDDIVIKSIYANVKSERTIRRDLDGLKAMKLLVDNGKMLSVNYDIMTRFIGINPDALFRQPRAEKPR